MSNKTILITGANGQLGNEMQAIAASSSNYNFLFTDKEELAIDDLNALQEFFKIQPIYFCVNCAAYTAVDKAESEMELANRINGLAVGYLAAVCKENNSGFIHISTDYVFDGAADSPYVENHPVNPVNAYGTTKLNGEVLAQQNNPTTIIIRTSWVYSFFGNNFVKTMLRLMKERESLNVVSDQLGCPTYAADLAAAIMKIIESNSTEKNIAGIYHYSNRGVTNWHEFAMAINELSGSNCVVNPIATSQYPTPAKRPQYSVMDTSKIQQTFNLQIPEWKESLKICIDKLLK